MATRSREKAGSPGPVPDAAHAACVRAKLASLQLAGHDLAFSLQLSGQPFKL